MSNSVNKKEGTLLFASLMTILAIVIALIGMVLIVGVSNFLFGKILGVNIDISMEELLKNQLLVPDYYSDLLANHVFLIVLVSILFPFVFFFAIKDRFKGSYMNLIDFKKYKLILAGLVLFFVIGTGGSMYALYNTSLEKEVKRNVIIQEQKLDEEGYFNAGVEKMEIIPKLCLICISISGVISLYVALATAEATNKKNIMALMQNNVYYEYENVQQNDVVNPNNSNVFK